MTERAIGPSWRPPIDVRGAPPAPEIEAVKGLYRIEEPREVGALLRTHPELASLLVEGYAALSNGFGQRPEIRLTVFSDPEESAPPKLLACVVTALPPAAALERQARFNRSWWLNRIDSADGRLSFHVEFA